MSLDLVGLALLMGLVTYPSRALPILAPGIERLPAIVLDYLRLVGPAVLAALVNAAIVTPEGSSPSFQVGIEWVALAVCGAVTALRGNLLLGLIGGVGLVAIARATGLASLPV